MVVTVQVVERVSDSARRASSPAPLASAIARLTNELAIELRAMHPGSTDPALRTWFVADVPDGARGARILEQLRRNPLIAAAYSKPPEAMP